MKNKYIFLYGRMISILGTQIYNFVFALWILYTTSSAVNYAVTLVLEILPRILFGTVAGVAADRYDRKKIMVWSDMLSAGILVFAFLGMRGNREHMLVLLYSVTFFLNSISSFFEISLTAALDQMFGRDELQHICSLNEGIVSLVSLTAPALGAFLYSAFDFRYFLLLNGISFFLSALAEMGLELQNRENYSERRSFQMELKTTVSYIRQERVILLLYTAAIFINIFYNVGVTLSLPVIVTIYLEFSEMQYGIINMMLSLGMMLGAFAAGKWRIAKKYKAIMVSLFAEAMCIGMFCLPGIVNWNISWFYFIAAVGCVLDFAVSMLNINVRVLMQELIPSGIKGKVMGTLSAFCLSISPLILAIGGAYIDSHNPYQLVLLSGTGFLVLNVILMKNEFFRKTDRKQAGAENAF